MGYVDGSDFDKYKIVFDEEKVKIGIDDTKIEFDIGTEVDKSMAKIFGFTIKDSYDAFVYSNNFKKYATVVNSKKPGLATLVKQFIMMIGDMVSFLFKIIKKAIEQILNSFILPILALGTPYTLPITIKKVIDIIKGIVEMVKEAMSLVTDTVKWLLEKVGGKILKINIPIPEFKIPIFGIPITIPEIDINNLMKTDLFASLSVDKIKNLKDKLSNIDKEISDIKSKISEKIEKSKEVIIGISIGSVIGSTITEPIKGTDVSSLNGNGTDLNGLSKSVEELEDRKKTYNTEIDRQSKIDDSEIETLSSEINNLEYDISKLQEIKSDNNKNFLSNSLKTIEACIETLERSLFDNSFETVKVIIEIHDVVIMKKKEYLDEYLKDYVINKKGYNVSNYYNITYNNNNVINLNDDSIIKNLTKDKNDIISGNTNSNLYYFINIYEKSKENTPINANYITYEFTNKRDIFINSYNILNDIYNKKIVIREVTIDNKLNKIYSYKFDYIYVKNIVRNLLDELEKEEKELELIINNYNIQGDKEILDKIQILDDFLNAPYIKKLKPEEYYISPILTDYEIKNLTKLKQEIPKQGVLVKEILSV